MISLSKDHNPNYLAKVVEMKGLRKHENADRLQVATIDFQTVITGLGAKDGDVYVFFPLESRINESFLSFTNSFRHKEKNLDPEVAGFFEDNGRVRAVRLRGEKSMGYLVPAHEIEDWCGLDEGILDKRIGEEFDTVGDKLLLEKYFVPVKFTAEKRQGKKPRISRLVDGQVHLHVDTENLRRNAHKIKPEDEITISYKVHGTSWWVSNVLVNRKLSLIEKIADFLKIPVKKTEYDHVYGSRKVVKNEYETQGTNDFYDGDLWGMIKDEVKEFVPKGYTLYGECIGFTPGGGYIQAGYDYGCKQGEHKLMIYRITSTNADGIVTDLSTAQIQEYCKRFGLETVPVFYKGIAELAGSPDALTEHWNEEFVKYLEKKYNEKDCYLCTARTENKVPEEGIVVRKESMFEFEAYKLKSFKFLEMETLLLDEGTQDMESGQ